MSPVYRVTAHLRSLPKDQLHLFREKDVDLKDYKTNEEAQARVDSEHAWDVSQGIDKYRTYTISEV